MLIYFFDEVIAGQGSVCLDFRNMQELFKGWLGVYIVFATPSWSILGAVMSTDGNFINDAAWNLYPINEKLALMCQKMHLCIYDVLH